jgi:hypothetical protein
LEVLRCFVEASTGVDEEMGRVADAAVEQVEATAAAAVAASWLPVIFVVAAGTPGVLERWLVVRA